MILVEVAPGKPSRRWRRGNTGSVSAILVLHRLAWQVGSDRRRDDVVLHPVRRVGHSSNQQMTITNAL